MMGYCSMEPQTRRRLLKALAGTGVTAGLAGCAGGNGEGDGDGEGEETDTTTEGEMGNETEEPTQDFSWPPPRNIVEIANDSEPGGLLDVLERLWQPYFEEAVEGDVSAAISNEPGAGGVRMTNRIANEARGHGGSMGSMRAISLIANSIGRDDANYDPTELRHVVRFSADTRAIQMNPRNTPVEDHYDITWSEFQDFVTSHDEPLVQPLANPAHTVLGLFLYGQDPEISISGEDPDIDMVTVSGGSEARSAMARGDAHLYFGSFISNSTARYEFYYTQFCMVDPETDFYDSIADVPPQTSSEFGDNPEEKTLGNNVEQAAIVNTSYPQEAAQQAVSLVSDHHIAFLPPDTPDSIYETHAEAWQEAGESEELAQDVADRFAPPDHNPLAGQAVQDTVEQKYETLSGNEQIRTLIEEELF